ncbi:MAG: sigma-54 dependent transcriptional regulator [FCB group bacterium]|jgi:two-component system NtrC family response regulator|nr:sigma-54 dependent transcriptional regulator [FCB group bacterium]
MARILIIDDDSMLCSMLSRWIQRLGHEVDSAHTRETGLAATWANSYDVVYLDVNLPDGNGLDILPRIHEIPSRPEVIIITGSGKADGAELAIKSGAWDYIGKSFSRQEMTLPLVRALQYREERRTVRSRVFDRRGITGVSPSLERCLEAAAQAANSDASVLITGETGTGKELLATAIHENSARKHGNFVVVDCAALPDSLVESILFGHVKGAFTGADKDREGLVLQAHNGTLFLDEVGELPVHLQKAFLRVLQEHRIRPIGGQQEFSSDFRLIVATNRDLDKMAAEGQFRQDLLFRLRVLSVEVPPLRDRKEDIKTLAVEHMNKLCEDYGVATKGFSPDFFAALDSYDWPGNVRELLHILDSVFAVAGDDPVLFSKHLPMGLRVKMIRNSIQSETIDPPEFPQTNELPRMKAVRDTAIAEAEKRYLQELVAATKGDIQEACRIADLSASRLYELLKRYDIPRGFVKA